MAQPRLPAPEVRKLSGKWGTRQPFATGEESSAARRRSASPPPPPVRPVGWFLRKGYFLARDLGSGRGDSGSLRGEVRGGAFAWGTPLEKGRKEKTRPYFVLERSGGGIPPFRREGCDSAVLRTRCGTPPPRVNPDCAGPAAVQTRGNEAPPRPPPLLRADQGTTFTARLVKLGLRPLSNSFPLELSVPEPPTAPLPWPGAIFPERGMEEEPGAWPLLCILGTGVRKWRK